MEIDPAVIVPEDDELMEDAASDMDEVDVVGAGVLQVSSALSYAIWEGRPLSEIRAIVETQYHPNELLETPGGRFKQLGYLPLHDAAKARAPLEVITYLVERCPEAARVKTADEHAHLPLHLAISGHDNDEYSMELVSRGPRVEGFLVAEDVERCRLLIDAWPQALAERGRDGRLPLHLLLLGSQGITLESVRTLVDPHPGTLAVNDNDGWLPLHYAAHNVSVPLEAVQFLVAKHPAALLDEDREGKLPLHVALPYRRLMPVIQALVGPCPESLRVRNEDGNSPLHEAVLFEAPVSVLRYLVLQGPDGVRARNRKGELPLHIAAILLLSEAVEFLVEEWAESVHERDANGFPPMVSGLRWSDVNIGEITVGMFEYFFPRSPPHALLSEDSRGRLPLHLVLDQSDPSLDVVETLVRHCPEAVRHKDKDGQLPLHVAVARNRYPFAAHTLVREWQESLLERDDQGRLPIRIALSTGERLEFVVLLAEPCPQSLLERDEKGLLPVQVARARVVQNHDDPTINVCWSIVRRLVEICPDSLRERDADGRVLLHHELDLATPDFPFVRDLVDEWSGALCVRDNRGFLPMQLAATKDAPLAVVYYLARERPDLLLRRPSLVEVGGDIVASDRLSPSAAGPPRHGPRAGAGP
jgi:ankyrin repeat protein